MPVGILSDNYYARAGQLSGLGGDYTQGAPATASSEYGADRKALLRGKTVFYGKGIHTPTEMFVYPTGLGPKADKGLFNALTNQAASVKYTPAFYKNKSNFRKLLRAIRDAGQRNGLGTNYDPRRLNPRHDAVFYIGESVPGEGGYWSSIFQAAARSAGLNYWNEVRNLVGTGSATGPTFAAPVTPPLTKFIYRYINAMAGGGDKAAALLMLAAVNKPGVTIVNRAIKTRQFLEQEARRGSRNAQRILFFAVTTYRRMGGR